MDYLRASLGLICCLAGTSVNAGFAQLSPPAGFSQNAGSFLYRAAANAGSIAQNTVRTNAALNVGGRSILVPAAMRFAANAPTIAARAVFFNPALALGVGIASLAVMAWVNSQDVQWHENAWAKIDPNAKKSTGVACVVIAGNGVKSEPNPSCQAAANSIAWVYYQSGYTSVSFSCPQSPASSDRCSLTVGNRDGTYSGYVEVQTAPGSCPIGWYIVPAGCVQTPPMKTLSEDEFVDTFAPTTMPDAVPFGIPVDLPVEQPAINPSPFPDGTPAPFDVPQGNPQLVPNTDPQQWETPAVRVTPSPTPQNPWQVDTTPVTIKRPTPEPLKPLEPIKPLDPKPDERTPDLCEKYPDIVACQKLGDIAPTPVTNKVVDMNINKEEGFGPSMGQCPPPRALTLMGKTYAFSWQPMCDFAAMIRPLLIGFAWLSAAMSFMGLARKES